MSDNLEILRSDNYSFAEMEDYEKELYDAAEEIMNVMSAEKKATMEAFLEASIKVQGQKQSFCIFKALRMLYAS